MANICPKDLQPCLDDSCRVSQECVYGNHGPMLNHCHKCKAFYSYEDHGCECEPEYDDEEDYEPTFDCHMDRHGSCGKAGSEECEFECPYRAS